MSSSHSPGASYKHTAAGVGACAGTVGSLPGIVGNVHIGSIDDPGVRRGSQGHSRQQKEYQSVHDEEWCEVSALKNLNLYCSGH